jgi:hypothetical protein
METGALQASHFATQDVFDRVIPLSQQNLLMIQERIGDSRDHNFRLGLRDAFSAAVIAEFSCHVPKDNVWWTLAPDGKTIAFVTFEGQEARVELRHTGSGAILHTYAGWGEPILFAPDGRRLAACRWENDHNGNCMNRIGVWDVAGGVEPAAIFDMPAPPGQFSPASFSPSGELLVDDHCWVWEVASGKMRFQVPDAGRRFAFTPDGRYLVTVGDTPSASWLAYFDVATGAELVERRVPFDFADGGRMNLRPATRDGRLLLAYRTGRFSTPDLFQQWIAKVPGLGSIGERKPLPAFALIESATGREVTRGEFGPECCTPGDCYLLSRTRQNIYKLWDIPPRKPLRWLLPAAAIWSIGFALFAAWRIRRARRVQAEANATNSAVSESSIEHAQEQSQRVVL